MTAYLYINSFGKEVRSHSYSAGSLFNECSQKYKLVRLDGWKEIELRASMEFGKAIENGIQAYHELNRNMEAALKAFHEGYRDREGWDAQKIKPLKYAPVERDWDTLAAVGEEMIKLYHLRLPSLPFDLSVPPEFQIKYYKEMFPGTDMAGIEFVSYIDMRAHSRLSLGDALGVDIKVMNKAIPEGMLNLDPQMCTYAWVTGISDWAFLNFIKTNRDLERGSNVSLLEPAGAYKAGTSVIVIKYQEFEPARPADPAKPKSKPKDEIPEETWIVEDESVIERMFQLCGKGQTSAEKDARNLFVRENATKVDKSILTKQQIQFVHGHIGLTEQLEASKRIAHEVVQIVYSNTENYRPKEGGIRFPHDICVRCPMRGICLSNPQLSATLVSRVDEDWDVIATEES